MALGWADRPKTTAQGSCVENADAAKSDESGRRATARSGSTESGRHVREVRRHQRVTPKKLQPCLSLEAGPLRDRYRARSTMCTVSDTPPADESSWRNSTSTVQCDARNWSTSRDAIGVEGGASGVARTHMCVGWGCMHAWAGSVHAYVQRDLSTNAMRASARVRAQAR